MHQQRDRHERMHCAPVGIKMHSIAMWRLSASGPSSLKTARRLLRRQHQRTFSSPSIVINREACREWEGLERMAPFQAPQSRGLCTASRVEILGVVRGTHVHAV